MPGKNVKLGKKNIIVHSPSDEHAVILVCSQIRQIMQNHQTFHFPNCAKLIKIPKDPIAEDLAYPTTIRPNKQIGRIIASIKSRQDYIIHKKSTTIFDRI